MKLNYRDQDNYVQTPASNVTLNKMFFTIRWSFIQQIDDLKICNNRLSWWVLIFISNASANMTNFHDWPRLIAAHGCHYLEDEPTPLSLSHLARSSCFEIELKPILTVQLCANNLHTHFNSTGRVSGETKEAIWWRNTDSMSSRSALYL